MASNHQVDRTPKSQFADDTTLIIEDSTSLRNATSIVNLFGVIFDLQLNKKRKENKNFVDWYFEQIQDRTFKMPAPKRSHKIPWNLPFP